MLEVRALEVGYGDGRRIVNGVDLRVDAGEMVAVIGQNGAGKSTLLKGIFNIAPFRSGDVVLDGASVFALPAPKLILAGLAYVPQNRSLFPKLTVDENLRLGGFLLRDRGLLERRLDELQTLFPILAERRRDYAASLSGGEQRMLEIARTLVMEPKLVMLDEPSIGLAPRMVDLVFATARKLAERGAAVLMVEQNVKKALQASDRGYVLELGRVQLSRSRRGADRRCACRQSLHGQARPRRPARRCLLPEIKDRLRLPATRRDQRIVRRDPLDRRRDTDRLLHAALQPLGRSAPACRRRHDFQDTSRSIDNGSPAVLLGDHRLEFQHVGLGRDGVDQRLRIDQHAFDLEKSVDPPRHVQGAARSARRNAGSARA